MESITLFATLEIASKRNASITAIYKEGAKTILSRSISSLALSMADQRRELGKEFLELASVDGVGAAPVELENGVPDQPTAPSNPVARDFLKFAFQVETQDYEFLAALAGAFMPVSTGAAERLAALAEQARKRAAWAQDHLELISLSRP